MFRQNNSAQKNQQKCDMFKISLNCLQNCFIQTRHNFRRLQDNLAATDCKRAEKCIGKTSNRRLIKMSPQEVSKTSFEDLFQDFQKFRKKKLVQKFLHVYNLGFTTRFFPVFRRQIRQGCGLITFSVTGIKRRGIISICYDGT